MFKIFSFGFNNGNMEKINELVHFFLDNVELDKFNEENREEFSSTVNQEFESENNNFIQLEQYEDMYLLTISLEGINLRELSIRYDPGILEINLKRLEVEKRGVGIISKSLIVKRAYNKKFENIEDIDTSQVIKSIDNGILSMRMPKKYSLENIVDVNSYEDNVDN